MVSRSKLIPVSHISCNKKGTISLLVLTSMNICLSSGRDSKTSFSCGIFSLPQDFPNQLPQFNVLTSSKDMSFIFLFTPVVRKALLS